jgi:hypothetical protein
MILPALAQHSDPYDKKLRPIKAVTDGKCHLCSAI